ncbi:MAG: type II toxin-antitoxin system VapC family toxin [Candidatus Brocadiia bacterium]
MDIVIDTSALLAVIIGEPERDRIVAATSGHSLVGPGSIPWEIGNAFSAMLKQRRLKPDDAQRGLAVFQSIPLRYVDIDLAAALSFASRADVYAYDAYFIECARQQASPLLTLDGGLVRAARELGVTLIEV